MFKIDELKLYSDQSQEYIYKFSEGINYFKGSNDTGKTEFYEFLDYMFGKSGEINNTKGWFKHLAKASLKFTYNDISYVITRTKDSESNSFGYADEENEECISKRIYVDRLNQVFGADREITDKIKEFTGENFTYRTFTLFNFLGETGQGLMNDFFDKCSEIEYKIKLPSLLDLIFNKNVSEIIAFEKELEELINEVKQLEKDEFKIEYIQNQINENINILGLNIVYTGINKERVLEKLEEAKNLNEIQKKKNENIVELKYLFNHINEQIKIYESSTIDLKQIDIANKNRKSLLNNLEDMIKTHPEFDYMIEPINTVLNNIDNSISLTNYLITDKTISELDKKRKKIKNELDKCDHYTKLYDLNEKEKACTLLENYLMEDKISSSKAQLKEKKDRIIQIRRQLKELKKAQDNDKINSLSEQITRFYKSATSAKLVQEDIAVNGFKIVYIKNGNTLQPRRIETINYEGISKEVEVNYSQGSMARHTLIQLSGYLAFLRLLLNEGIYPIIPILVIDHISKPFDENNIKGIGEIINFAISMIGIANLQIFLFDDETYEKLSINPNHAENLVTNEKTGFIPFYTPPINER